MTKKVLSIDGGGIKGVFPASFLASMEEQNNSPIYEHFDLIVGTSTGGIIALGLGLGFSAKDLLNFYEHYGPKIFKGNKFLNTLRHLGLSKYKASPLKNALTETFGTRVLGESKTRLLIPSFDLDRGTVHLYKTAHRSEFVTDYKETIVNVALATSAAPTYFPIHKTSQGIPLADGGLFANNPAAVAAVEAIGVLGWSKGDVKMLSIGCTESPLDASARGGKLLWSAKIADVFLASQSSASLGMAQHLLGSDAVFRINPIAPNRKYSIDSVSGISSLKGLGKSEARLKSNELIDFFTGKAEEFKPYHHL